MNCLITSLFPLFIFYCEDSLFNERDYSHEKTSSSGTHCLFMNLFHRNLLNDKK